MEFRLPYCHGKIVVAHRVDNVYFSSSFLVWHYDGKRFLSSDPTDSIKEDKKVVDASLLVEGLPSGVGYLVFVLCRPLLSFGGDFQESVSLTCGCIYLYLGKQCSSRRIALPLGTEFGL
jgi:hypothetical protein